jgi:hypothetical protein
MQYIVLEQYIPGIDQIWVARLTPEDPLYIFDTEEECIAKASELESNDPTGRKYRSAPLDSSVAI